MLKLFAKLDMFSQTPGLKYNQGKGYSTFIGAVISIGFYFFFTSIFVIKIIQVCSWSYSSKDFYQTSEKGENNFLDLKNMPLALGLKLYIYSDKEKTRKVYYGTEVFQFINFVFLISDSQDIPINNNLTFAACNDILFSNHYDQEVKGAYLSYFNVTNITLDKFVCLKFDKDYKIYKSKNPRSSFTLFDGFSMTINKKNISDHEHLILNTELLLYSDPYNTKTNNPFYSKLPGHERIDRSLFGSYNRTEKVSLTYRVTNYTIDHNLILSEMETRKHFLIKTLEKTIDPRERVLSMLLALRINIDLTVENIQIRYLKLTDLFSFLGGLLKFISLPIRLVKFIYRKFVRDELLENLNELDEVNISKMSESEEVRNDSYTENRWKPYKNNYYDGNSNEENRNRTLNNPPLESNTMKADSISSQGNNLKDVLISSINNEKDDIVTEKSVREECSLKWWEKTYYSLCKCCRNEKIERSLKKRKTLSKKLDYLLDIKTVLKAMYLSDKISCDKVQDVTVFNEF